MCLVSLVTCVGFGAREETDAQALVLVTRCPVLDLGMRPGNKVTSLHEELFSERLDEACTT